MSEDGCPFCERVAEAKATDRAAVAFPDAFPVTEGHTLVVPGRHVASLLELGADEQGELWRVALAEVRRIRESANPDGFNVGFNEGAAAGQTIEHAHLHLIPRRSGDTPEPRGGIRWVIPERAAYWDR